MIVFFLGIWFCPSSTHAEAAQQEVLNKQEIEFLQTTVQQAPCEFFRNDKSYDAQKAVEHILMKYHYFESRIKTAEDFIDLCATRSLITGKEYGIQCADQPKKPLAEWLADHLYEYRLENKN